MNVCDVLFYSWAIESVFKVSVTSQLLYVGHVRGLKTGRKKGWGQKTEFSSSFHTYIGFQFWWVWVIVDFAFFVVPALKLRKFKYGFIARGGTQQQ